MTSKRFLHQHPLLKHLDKSEALQNRKFIHTFAQFAVNLANCLFSMVFSSVVSCHLVLHITLVTARSVCCWCGHLKRVALPSAWIFIETCVRISGFSVRRLFHQDTPQPTQFTVTPAVIQDMNSNSYPTPPLPQMKKEPSGGHFDRDDDVFTAVDHFLKVPVPDVYKEKNIWSTNVGPSILNVTGHLNKCARISWIYPLLFRTYQAILFTGWTLFFLISYPPTSFASHFKAGRDRSADPGSFNQHLQRGEETPEIHLISDLSAGE